MYEHSYHVGFGAEAAAYDDAFMQNINWAQVRDAIQRAGPPVKARYGMVVYDALYAWCRGDAHT